MYHHFHHIYFLKDISEIFSNFAVGIGALGASFTAYKVFEEWRDSKAKKEKVERLKRAYPLSLRGKDYKIADSDKKRGKIYIVDLKNSKKYWIQSSSTFFDLGFSWDMVEHMPDGEFASYEEKEPILTSGTPGS